MSIMVNPFLDIFTRVAELFKPVNCCSFTDAGVFPCQIECGKYGVVDMATEEFGCYGSEILSCQISPYSMQDSFVIEECVLTMFGICFGWRKMLVFQKVSLIPAYLKCKVKPLFLSNPAFFHAPCNCQAHTEARPLTFIMALVLILKLCVFKNSCKLSDHLK